MGVKKASKGATPNLFGVRAHAALGSVSSLARVVVRGVARPYTFSMKPRPDSRHENAFYPSLFSLGLYVPPKTDFSGNPHAHAYQGNRWKVLTILTDNHYLPLKDGTLFSTGNHPVEMLLPLMHLDEAGFGIDIATPSGNSAKLEDWAMPVNDPAVLDAYHTLLPKLTQPLKLAEVVESALGPDSDYLAVFIPGGHGALNGIPDNVLVQKVLDWAVNNDRFIISLCHGPVALLASTIGRDSSIFSGYEACVFPDSLDKGTNVKIGYLPGPMAWLVAEKLRSIGVKVVNTGVTGRVHRDRNLLTGDSPLASNNLGLLAVDALLERVQGT